LPDEWRVAATFPKENCKASCAGQAATQTMHALHSADRICIRRSTGKPAGQARAHFPQSMQASASRRIFTGLSSDTNPISAP
jgi:hypothetical protein